MIECYPFDGLGIRAKTRHHRGDRKPSPPSAVAVAAVVATDCPDDDAMGISGGGVHDAAYVAGVRDTAMVFAVGEGGRSHASWDDCYGSANTLANAGPTPARG